MLVHPVLQSIACSLKLDLVITNLIHKQFEDYASKNNLAIECSPKECKRDFFRVVCD